MKVTLLAVLFDLYQLLGDGVYETHNNVYL